MNFTVLKNWARKNHQFARNKKLCTVLLYNLNATDWVQNIKILRNLATENMSVGAEYYYQCARSIRLSSVSSQISMSTFNPCSPRPAKTLLLIIEKKVIFIYFKFRNCDPIRLPNNFSNTIRSEMNNILLLQIRSDLHISSGYSILTPPLLAGLSVWFSPKGFGVAFFTSGLVVTLTKNPSLHMHGSINAIIRRKNHIVDTNSWYSTEALNTIALEKFRLICQPCYHNIPDITIACMPHVN